MTNDEATNAIFARWINLWPAASGGVAYATDNNIGAEQVDQPFARVGIVSLDSEQRSLGGRGNRRWNHEGMIEVRLSGPINAGRGQLDALAKIVRTIYQGERFGEAPPAEEGVTTQAAAISELRRDRESPSRWLLVVTIPFEYTEIS